MLLFETNWKKTQLVERAQGSNTTHTSKTFKLKITIQNICASLRHKYANIKWPRRQKYLISPFNCIWIRCSFPSTIPQTQFCRYSLRTLAYQHHAQASSYSSADSGEDTLWTWTYSAELSSPASDSKNTVHIHMRPIGSDILPSCCSLHKIHPVRPDYKLMLINFSDTRELCWQVAKNFKLKGGIGFQWLVQRMHGKKKSCLSIRVNNHHPKCSAFKRWVLVKQINTNS